MSRKAQYENWNNAKIARHFGLKKGFTTSQNNGGYIWAPNKSHGKYYVECQGWDNFYYRHRQAIEAYRKRMIAERDKVTL